MRSYDIVEWGRPLALTQADNPEPRGTEVLLAVDACGVCHSDLHVWQGYFELGRGQRINLPDRGAKLPFAPGHEIVGTVVAAGPDADGVAAGDRRVVYPWIGCRTCAVCARGDEWLCAKPQYIGTRRAGGFADHVLVPHPQYLVDYDGVPADRAATYACAGITAYRGLKKALGGLPPMRNLLLVGAGGVGINGLSIAPAMTDARLIVADRDPAKRELARQAGAQVVIDNTDPGVGEQILELTDGEGVDASVDFVGAAETSQFALASLRSGGTHVVVGLYGGMLEVPMVNFPFKRLNVRGSFVGSIDDLRELIALAREGKIAAAPIASRPLDDANVVMRELLDGQVQGRIVLTP